MFGHASAPHAPPRHPASPAPLPRPQVLLPLGDGQARRAPTQQGASPERRSWIVRRPATRPLLLAVMPSAERGTCSMDTASCAASVTSRGERKSCNVVGVGRGRAREV